MQKSYSLAIAVLCVVAIPNSSEASKVNPQSKKVLSIFLESKTSIQNQLEELEQQFEAGLDEIDESSKAKEIQIENEAMASSTQLDSTLVPQIKASQQKLDSALNDFSTAGVVEVQKELRASIGYSAHRLAGSYLACPKFTEQIPVQSPITVKDPCIAPNGDYPKPAKISKWDPTGSLIRGDYWQPGEKTYLVVPKDYEDKRGHFVDIDQMIAASEISPTNLIEYNRVTAILKTEPINLSSLKSKFERERNAILATKSKKLSENSAMRDSLIDDLEEEFNAKKQELQALETIDNLGILAAKRASKNPGNFDKAFSIAFRFEYNKQQLELIANEEWDGDLSYKSINTMAKVLVLLEVADSIVSKYNLESASKFNTSLGTTFTRDAGFRNIQKYVSLKYQKATGKRTAISV